MEAVMISVVAFLSSTIGRVLVIGGGALALWVAFASHYQSKGAAKERAKIERAGEKNAAKAEAARRSVDKLPDDRLRDAYFRD
jgi:hypothetical protein